MPLLILMYSTNVLFFFLLVTFHCSNFQGVNVLAKFVALAAHFTCYLSTFVHLIVIFFFFCLSLFTVQIFRGSTFFQKFVALAAPIFYTFRCTCSLYHIVLFYPQCDEGASNIANVVFGIKHPTNQRERKRSIIRICNLWC